MNAPDSVSRINVQHHGLIHKDVRDGLARHVNGQDQQLAPERTQVLNLKSLRKQAAVIGGTIVNIKTWRVLQAGRGEPLDTFLTAITAIFGLMLSTPHKQVSHSNGSPPPA